MARVVYFVLTSLLSLAFCFPCIASADWAKRVAGPQGVDAIPTGIAIDDAGNVYVAGHFGSYPMEPTYVIMKYDAQGNRKWLKRQRGFDHYFCHPLMAATRNGNVYLFGPSPNGDHAMLIIKYDADGTRSWTRRFLGESMDINPSLITADDENVYVTGLSTKMNGEVLEYEIVTAKYNSSGTLKWTARYKDPANARLLSTAIAVDEHGNIYVGGRSQDQAGGTYRSVTMKYDSEGILRWKRVYRDGQPNGAHSMVVDSNGNVYLTGYTISDSGMWDLVTLKYDTLGTRQWIRKYNGPGDTKERPRDMTVDAEGNVYVTGVFWGNEYGTFTIKYNTNGVRQWVHTYEGGYHEPLAIAPSLSVDGSGNVYLTTSDDSFGWGDMATVKINSDGVQQWVKTYNGKEDRSDYGEGIALDANGNIYVIGESTGPDGSDDIVTIKYEQ